MKKPSRAMQAKWSAKLRETGFADLEGVDRNGPLSDRGNLHAVESREDSQEHLATRMTAGAGYTRWAESVLHAHRFASPTERRAWELHAAGAPLREIGTELGIGYHGARDLVAAVKRALSDRPDRGREGSQCKSRVRKIVDRSDPSLLLRLASILLRGQLDQRP